MQIVPALRRALPLVISMCLLATRAPAEDRLRLRWNDLAPLITGKRVWLPLNEGVRVAGTVREVESTGLKVEVTKTSDRKTYPKGLVSIPRSMVSTIQLNKPSGHKGVIIGGAVGGGTGAALGGVLGLVVVSEGVMAAGIGGPIAIGLLVGWLIDSIAHHGGMRITVMPD
ncbi:MAG: hypothetical protein HY236_06635 [Acidobacteria bacterium]|nr:hypothetical protein [Acidobacteriota bacterium]